MQRTREKVFCLRNCVNQEIRQEITRVSSVSTQHIGRVRNAWHGEERAVFGFCGVESTMNDS